jgi:hypothetical protein
VLHVASLYLIELQLEHSLAVGEPIKNLTAVKQQCSGCNREYALSAT